MISAVENRQKPPVRRRYQIACWISGVAGLICLAVILHATGYNLAFLLDIGEGRAAAVCGALLQIPAVFAAVLMLSVFIIGLWSGAGEEKTPECFRRILLALIIFAVWFVLNCLNMFVAGLMKDGPVQEVLMAVFYIFLEAFFVLVPAIVITLVLLALFGSGTAAGQTAKTTREVCRSLKTPAGWAVFLVVSVAFIFSGQRSSASIRVDSFTSFEAADLAGNPVDQTVFADHDLTLVNVWATFCGPCKAEMPDLAELHEEYAAQGFQVVGICGDITDADGQLYQKEYEDALQIAAETHADVYLNLNPAGDLMNGFLRDHVPAFPTSIFVDSEGQQVGDMIIGSRSKDEWKAEIGKRLDMVANGTR